MCPRQWPESEVRNPELLALLLEGFAFPRAGLDMNGNHTFEVLFSRPKKKAFSSTATLAWGVNLPA
jgi:replicative superfamily II helicase